MNYRLVAINVGDILKYDTSVNQINRTASALFQFQQESFPNDAITSVRAKIIHDWILTLAKQKMEPEQRNEKLIAFCRNIAPSDYLERINDILKNANISVSKIDKESNSEFLSRSFHHEIVKHSKKLFVQGHYFHAVFEACKVYNKLVQSKAKSSKDGQSLMLEVWGPEKGVLKITPCQTETDSNIQNGVKFLSAGLMQAIRNPTAHEPALDWPIERKDCLDLLSFLSFLFRKLDDAVYYKA